LTRVIEAFALTGRVMGMQKTEVNPRGAAALVPVSMVSEFSCPGSRRWTCMSIKPGVTTRPVASNTSAPLAREIFPGAAISDMVSPSRRTSRTASVLDVGSRTRPFLIRSMRRFLGFGVGFHFKSRMRAFRGADHQQVENGHTSGDTVGDLLENGGLRAVSNFGSNFHAAVDRPGMKNQGFGLGEFHALGVELIKQDVIALRKRRFVQAVGLQAKDDEQVGVFKSVFGTKPA